MTPNGPIVTKRLFLRPVELGDAIPTAALMTPSVSACLENWPPRLTVEEAAVRIAESRRQTARRIGTDWGVFLKPDLALIGWVGLRRSTSAISTLRASYWLGEAYHRQGYGTEAFSAAIERARAVWPLLEIEATTLPDNFASMNLLERLGFVEIERDEERSLASSSVKSLKHFLLRGDVTGWPAEAINPWPALSRVL